MTLYNQLVKAQVGQTVLFVRSYGDKPVETKVTKVTRTGQFYLEGKPDRWNAQGYGICRTTIGRVYPMECLCELNEAHTNANARREEKRQAEEKRQTECEERLAKELAETDAAMTAGLSRGLFVSAPSIMPDGSRIYTVRMPVKEEMTARKGEWEFLVVRVISINFEDPICASEMWRRSDGDNKVRFAVTWTNKSSGSWPSCSEAYATDDQQALRLACNRVYQNW